jgi:glycosyltransferase involved in cell wall biosynthesis
VAYKILVLTKYESLGSSSRYRFYQYLSYLKSDDFIIELAPLLDNNYIVKMNRDTINYNNRTINRTEILGYYFQRLKKLIQCWDYDLLWIEKEILPYVPAWLERILTQGVPYVLDYDDAQFHRYDHYASKIVKLLLARKIDHVIANSKLTIVGNEYIADRAHQAGAKRVEIIPTVVDLDHYSLKKTTLDHQPFNIGWIGSPTTTRYVEAMEPVFQSLNKKYNCKFTMIGARDMNFENLDLNIKQWHEDSEVENLKSLDVGIMPLDDNIWEQGKCGIKLIQYMACGLPVVGTPIGVNREIIQHGINGFQATSPDQWIEHLSRLAEDPALRYSMGEEGRSMVESSYCLEVTAPKLAQLLRSCI